MKKQKINFQGAPKNKPPRYNFKLGILLALIFSGAIRAGAANFEENASGKKAAENGEIRLALPIHRCHDILNNQDQSYRSIFELKKLFHGINPPIENSQEIEKVFWSELEQLHEFLNLYMKASPFYDLLVSKDIGALRESLDLSSRVPNKIALELKVLESRGLRPSNPNVLIRALLKLSIIQQDMFMAPCSIADCRQGILVDQRCIFGNCQPQLSQDFHFEPDGTVNAIWYFEYPVKLTLWGHDIVIRERRELEIDDGTLAVRAQNAAGKSYMDSLIKTAQLNAASKSPWTFIFMDLNNLGLVNYFLEGQKTGDAYISAFASVVRQNIMTSDHFFRVGGDEFVIISESRSTKNLLIFIKSIMDQFYNDEGANKILNTQWSYIENAIKEIEETSNYLDLTHSAFAEILKSDWLIEASEDFSRFQRNFETLYKPQILKGILWQRFLMRPTFSVGSRNIQSTDDYNHLVALTSRQSGESKKLYKEHQGANAIKLGGEKTNEKLIEENIEKNSLVLPPIFPPL